MVFQHFSLFESMTTLENVALALPPQDLDELRGRLETTAQDYGLTYLSDQPTSMTSSRRAVAR